MGIDGEISICLLHYCGWQGDHACHVEASKVQGHIPTGDPVCADTYSTICYLCLLGIRRPASQPLQCLFTSPKDPIQRHGCHPHALPSGQPNIHQHTLSLSLDGSPLVLS